MIKKEKKPYGYIYRATNEVNGKLYIGQTVTSRWKDNKIPIEERWKEEVQEAYSKYRRRKDLRYIESAIIKHGSEKFKVIEQDIAYSQKELDAKEKYWIKELDAMNPEKGYNMTEGGEGGRLGPEALEKLSNAISDKYQKDPEYYNKQASERRERANNPEWRAKMTKINRERAKDPEWRKKMSKVGSEKWQEKEYQKKQNIERKERAKNPVFSLLSHISTLSRDSRDSRAEKELTTVSVSFLASSGSVPHLNQTT